MSATRSLQIQISKAFFFFLKKKKKKKKAKPPPPPKKKKQNQNIEGTRTCKFSED